VKDAAASVMEEAYLTASAQGRLPASARQVMYAARNAIQEQTGKQLDDGYFTQVLLPDYIAEHDLDWHVVFDDRGHLIEPHTEREIGLGTLAVDGYIDGCEDPKVEGIALTEVRLSTSGPAGRFGGLMFTEKEGFMPLFEHVHLAERFDTRGHVEQGHAEHGGPATGRSDLQQVQNPTVRVARLRQSRFLNRLAVQP
jgi:hypothetical protein